MIPLRWPDASMPVPEGVMLKDDDYILMRCKIDEVFEHYAAQPEY